jgi:hypothetical protein
MSDQDIRPTTGELERAFARAWSDETCAPEDRASWTPQNAARGQCITTAVVVHDFLGGELVRGEVQVDGVRVDYHWWNRLPDGTEVDFTKGQFAPHEHVVGSQTFQRPTGNHRVREQSDRLQARVLLELDSGVT